MTAWRVLLRVLAGWTALVVILVAGLVVLATSVEAASFGVGALWLGLLAVPGLLVLLAPLLVGIGVALGAARMDGRGERVALQASGFGPMRTAVAAATLGALVGLSALAVADHLVPWTEARAAALRGRPGPDWVWLDDGALRLSDGLLVRVDAGRIQSVVAGVALDPQMVARQRALQEPRTAAGADLAAATSLPARLEWMARRARVLSCLLLAVFAWLPEGTGTGARLGGRLLQLLLFVALDQSLLAIGAQGRLPLFVAAFGVPIVAVSAIVANLSRRRAPRTRRR